MSEEHVVAPAETPAATPAAEPPPVETPPPTPAAETPAVVETPAPTEAPAETPAAPELTPHTETPGALQAEPQKPEEKPTEPEKTAEIIELSPPPVEYELTLPENFQFAEEQLDNFKGLAAEAKIAPEVAQKLVDMHVEQLQAYDRAALQAQHDAFAKFREGWRNEMAADPDYGGAGFETNKASAIKALTMFPDGPWKDRLNHDLVTSGMAENPAFFRYLIHVNETVNTLQEQLRVALEKWKDPEPVVAQTPRAPIPGAAGRAPGAAGRRLAYSHPRGRSGNSAAE